MAQLGNIIGIIGVILILLAYSLLQCGKLHPLKFSYPFMNLVGAILILISLTFSWNLPSAVIETAWVIISLFGILRWYRHSRKK